MGLDLELFPNKVDRKFICSICQKVFVDPVVSSCCHLFCQLCFRKRLENKSSKYCPECGSILSASSTDVSFQLKRQLLQLAVQCCHACGITCIVADLPDHVTEVCPNTPVHCSNKDRGCRKIVKRKEVALHEEECDFRYVVCEACGFRVQYANLYTHQSKTKCLEKKLRQQVARASKSTNILVKCHRDNIVRQNIQIERHARQAASDYNKSKQQRYVNAVRLRKTKNSIISNVMYGPSHNITTRRDNSLEDTNPVGIVTDRSMRNYRKM